MALDTKLAPQPHPLDILVVGGAAIALLWNPSRLTRYVDVVERLPGVVEQAAAAVAAETEGLSEERPSPRLCARVRSQAVR